MANSANNAARKPSGRVLPSLKEVKANKKAREGKNIATFITDLIDRLHNNVKERGLITAGLIKSVFESEVTFADTAIEAYFRAPSTAPKEMPNTKTTVMFRNTWLCQFSDEYKNNVATIDAEKAKKGVGNKRNVALIKELQAFNDSIGNILDTAIRAGYFMRHGGKLDNVTIGMIKTADYDDKGKFTLYFINPAGKLALFPGLVSSAKLIEAGKLVYEAFPGKPVRSDTGRAAAKKAREAAAAAARAEPNAAMPVPLYTRTIKNASETLRNALLARTKELQAKDKDAKPATYGHLPKPTREATEKTLSELLAVLFAKEKTIELIDVETWMKANMKGFTISSDKHIPPLVVKEATKED